MKTQRPVLNEKKVTAFLEGASDNPKASFDGMGSKEKKASPCNVSSKPKKKVTCQASTSSMSIKQRPIGKFMVEMSSELRKKIKFRAVADGVSMNELIVAVLQRHFK